VGSRARGSPPEEVVACTYVVLALEAASVVALDGANAGSISADDLNDGTAPAPSWWKLELLDALGATVQSDEGSDPTTVTLDFDCSNLGVNSVKVSAWDRALDANAWYEPCVATETVQVNVTDPLGACP